LHLLSVQKRLVALDIPRPARIGSIGHQLGSGPGRMLGLSSSLSDFVVAHSTRYMVEIEAK
jgi:hypothetical protein